MAALEREREHLQAQALSCQLTEVPFPLAPLSLVLAPSRLPPGLQAALCVARCCSLSLSLSPVRRAAVDGATTLGLRSGPNRLTERRTHERDAEERERWRRSHEMAGLQPCQIPSVPAAAGAGHGRDAATPGAAAAHAPPGPPAPLRYPAAGVAAVHRLVRAAPTTCDRRRGQRHASVGQAP